MAPLLQAENVRKDFSGSMLELATTVGSDSGTGIQEGGTYTFISAGVKSTDTSGTTGTTGSTNSMNSLFEVSSDGGIYTAGGAVLDGDKGLAVNTGSATLKGGLSLNKRTIVASDIIDVPVDGSSFVEISNDGQVSKNIVKLTGNIPLGCAVIISNADTEPLQVRLEGL